MGNDLTQKMRNDWDERATTRESAIAAILDGWTGSEDSFFAQGKAHWEDMQDALALKGIYILPSSVGCELGCGVGRMTMWMASCFKRLYATDISANMISLAPYIGNVIYRITDTLEYIPQVDFVISHLVLQHIPKVAFWKYINEAYDILVKGGVFISQLHETSEPVEHLDSTILVRGYTKQELEEGIDENKWEVVSVLEPAGISEVWRWLILRKA
jgi:SAM-dependent methyltransferase